MSSQSSVPKVVDVAKKPIVKQNYDAQVLLSFFGTIFTGLLCIYYPDMTILFGAFLIICSICYFACGILNNPYLEENNV